MKEAHADRVKQSPLERTEDWTNQVRPWARAETAGAREPK
jgi:hypothetical protein